MDPVFLWRTTRLIDLSRCLAIHPAKNGAAFVGHTRMVEAWKRLLNARHATRSAVVEMQEGSRSEIVGFGLASFVTKTFAEDELRRPRAGLNDRIIESIVQERPVIATYSEVRDSNTRGDLYQIILDTSWDTSRLSEAEWIEVHTLLGVAFQNLFAGYRLGCTLAEMVDALDRWGLARHPVFRPVESFAAFCDEHPETRWNNDRMLVQATKENFRDHTGSVAAGVFQHQPRPQFRFAQGEQELLELALDGVDDAEAAKALFVTLPAIKRRWANIFARVAVGDPDLCPLDSNGTRGAQKRQRVLAWIRQHPEELRPFNHKLDLPNSIGSIRPKPHS